MTFSGVRLQAGILYNGEHFVMAFEAEVVEMTVVSRK
jgi:hypothetical protein